MTPQVDERGRPRGRLAMELEVRRVRRVPPAAFPHQRRLVRASR